MYGTTRECVGHMLCFGLFRNLNCEYLAIGISLLSDLCLHTIDLFHDILKTRTFFSAQCFYYRFVNHFENDIILCIR